MKKTIIKLVVFVGIGFGVFFAYEHFFGCKGSCDKASRVKDSTSVVVSDTIKKDTTKTAVVIPTIVVVDTITKK